MEQTESGSFFDERNITEKLRWYNEQRAKLLEPLSKFSFLFDNALSFQLTVWGGSITLIVLVFRQILQLSLFSLHPTCMVIGGVICMSEGISTYRNQMLLYAFSPIMAGSTKNKLYAIHKTMQIFAVLFIALGYSAARLRIIMLLSLIVFMAFLDQLLS